MDQETPAGLMLHYRSKRRGFSTYTIGQLKAVAETYYKIELAIEIKESEIKFDTVHVSFQVFFYKFFHLLHHLYSAALSLSLTTSRKQLPTLIL